MYKIVFVVTKATFVVLFNYNTTELLYAKQLMP